MMSVFQTTSIGLVGVCAGTVTSLAVWTLWTYGRNWMRYRHIPGPTPLPFFGNVLSLPKGVVIPDFYASLRKQYGTVFKWFLGKQVIMVVADLEMVRLIGVKHFQVFHDRWFVLPPVEKKRQMAIQSGMLLAKGRYWASMRAAVQPIFHSHWLASYAPVVNRAASRVADMLAPCADKDVPVDLYQLLQAMTMDVIGRCAFGVELNALGNRGGEPPSKLLQAALGLMDAGAALMMNVLVFFPSCMHALLVWVMSVQPGMRNIKRCRNSVLATSLLLLKSARAKAGIEWRDSLDMDTVLTDTPEGREMVRYYQHEAPAEGSLPDMLARARNQDTGQVFEPYQLAVQSNTMLLAGYETTSSTLACAIYQLACNPEAEAALLREVDAFGRGRQPTYEDMAQLPYAEAVVQETLRLHPPAPITSRCASQDITLCGILFPAGTPVHIDIMALHMDPHYWQEPVRFRPERFLKDSEEAKARPQGAHMPFGVGPRLCVGYKFALEEAVLALVGLYSRYTFRLDPGRRQVPLKVKQGITVAPAEGVWVLVRSR